MSSAQLSHLSIKMSTHFATLYTTGNFAYNNTQVAILTLMFFRCGKCEGFLNPMHIDEFTSLLRPPASVCSEFEVETTVLPSGLGSYEILSVPCGSILLFLRGDARLTLDETTLDVKPGSIIFTASGAKVIVTSSDGKEVLFYRAHANLA